MRERSGRYRRQGNALAHDGRNRPCRYRAREGGEALSPRLRPEVQAQRREPAGSAGHRVSQGADRTLRSRLLLASTPRLQIRNHAVQQLCVLGVEVRSEHSERRRQFGPSRAARLDAVGDLGVRDTRAGGDRSTVLAGSWGGSLLLRLAAHHTVQCLSVRVRFDFTSAGSLLPVRGRASPCSSGTGLHERI